MFASFKLYTTETS